MCHITTIVSGAVSFGVLAGVLTGVVYVVLLGLKRVGKLRVTLEEEAANTRRKGSLLTEGLCVQCASTHGPSTVEQCCESCVCNASACTGQRNRARKNSRKVLEEWRTEKEEFMISQDEEDWSDTRTVKIREKLEKLVEKLVGGSLDGVPVGKLSKHAGYVEMFSKYHDPLCQGLAALGLALHFSLLHGNGVEFESTRAAHSSLRSLVEKVVSEAVRLPNIKDILSSRDSGNEVKADSDFANKSYEDILATAILNKIIEQCQKRQFQMDAKKTGRRKSQTSSVKHVKTKWSGEKGAGNDNNDDDFEDSKAEYHSDWSDTSRSEQLSLTIEEHIEEITTTYENSDEGDSNEEINYNGAIPFPESGRTIRNGASDDSESSDRREATSSATELVTSGTSWEDNWLFQRKRLRSRPNAHHPVPVPMLVPNPSQDYRALIGGVDADDLSDMSECSDSALEDVVLAADGETEVAGKEQSRRLPERSDGDLAKETEGSDKSKGFTETEDLTASPASLNSESSCPSFSQKERDVSVDYECFQKLDVELSEGPAPRRRSLDLTSSNAEGCNPPLKCRTAEREKEKWNHPVPLAENPYSADSISKREQRKATEYFWSSHHSKESVEFPSDSPVRVVEETIHPIYSRDYYVKASKHPTGDPNTRSTPVSQLLESSYENLSPRAGEEEVIVNPRGSHSIGDFEVKEGVQRIDSKKLISYYEHGSIRDRIAENTNIMLPSVKELTKKFAKGMEELSPKSTPTPSNENQSIYNGIPKCKKERQQAGKGADCEISKSALAINSSYIKLSPTSSITSRTAASHEIQTANKTENASIADTVQNVENLKSTKSLHSADSLGTAEKSSSNGNHEIAELTKSSSVMISKFTGKEIHSLTARSISKEFREELKNNASRRLLAKVDRGSSGESDHVELASEAVRNRPPTPPIDLQSKRKFWEDIISNSQK